MQHRGTVVIRALDQDDRLVLGGGAAAAAAAAARGHARGNSLFSHPLSGAGKGSVTQRNGNKVGQASRSSAEEDEFSTDHIDYWTLRFREPAAPPVDPDSASPSSAAPKRRLLHSLEDGFLAHCFDRDRKYVQKAMLTAVFIWGLYVINDIQKNSQGLRRYFNATLIIRAANCVIGIICTLLLGTAFVKKRRLLMPCVGFAMITFGLAQIIFSTWDENELDPSYSVVMILIPSTSSTLFKQRFIFTVVFQFSMLLLYIVLTYSLDQFHSSSDLVLTALGLFCANILFAVHAYRREYKMRKVS